MTLRKTLDEQEQQQQAVPITRLAERVVYENRFITLYDDDVRFSDGRAGRYLRLISADGKPGVVVLPLAAGRAGLVHVWRYPLAAWEWGLPRGSAHGDDPQVTARQEMLEELGAEPAALTPLGVMTPDSGILASVVYLFAAEYPEAVSAPLDTQEIAAVRWVPVAGLLAEIAGGRIVDGFTLAAVCRALCQGVIAS